jgi:hypothetical protein
MLYLEIIPHNGKLEVSLCEKKLYTVTCLERFECDSKEIHREIEAILMLTRNLTIKGGE